MAAAMFHTAEGVPPQCIICDQPILEIEPGQIGKIAVEVVKCCEVMKEHVAHAECFVRDYEKKIKDGKKKFGCPKGCYTSPEMSRKIGAIVLAVWKEGDQKPFYVPRKWDCSCGVIKWLKRRLNIRPVFRPVYRGVQNN